MRFVLTFDRYLSMAHFTDHFGHALLLDLKTTMQRQPWHMALETESPASSVLLSYQGILGILTIASYPSHSILS